MAIQFRMNNMDTTDSAAIKEQIVERLENGENKDDIILDLCEKTNISWSEAEAIVEQIHSEKKDQIVLAQSPLLVLIALGMFVGGLVLLGITVYDITTVYNTYVSAKSPASTGFLLYLFAYGGFFWELALIGIAMIAGSLRGMQDVWTAIFAKLGLFQNAE